MNPLPVPVKSFVFIAAIFLLIIPLPFIVLCFNKTDLGWAGLAVPVLTVLLLLPVFGAIFRRSLSLENGVLVLKTTFYAKEVPVSQIARVETGDECPTVFDFKKNGMGIPGLKSGWYVSAGVDYLVDFVEKPNICIYCDDSPEALALEVSNPSELKKLISD